MSPSVQSTVHLADYVAQKEAQERRKRMGILIACAVPVVLGLGFVGTRSLLAGSQALPVASYETTTAADFQALLAQDGHAVIMVDADGQRDTLRSLGEWEEIQQPQASTVADIAIDATTYLTPNHAAPKASFAIDGSLAVGEMLTFHIDNYNPETIYYLDLGNGHRVRVGGAQATYRYAKSGYFMVRLLVSSGQDFVPTHQEEIHITPSDTGNELATSRPATERPVATQLPVTSNDIHLSDQSAERSMRPVDSEPVQEIYLNQPQVSTPSRSNAASRMPVSTAELMPEFPGSNVGIARFLSRNLHYPQSARDRSIEGEVFVRFVVGADGQLSDIRIVKGIGGGCDEEALRLVRAMPRWIPGEAKGVPVPVLKTISIPFRLN
ncbi:MAG: hypothetical protein OHK0039_41430 [Bacteroidia bacterium]